MKINIKNTYADLPSSFYQINNPDSLEKPSLIKFNDDLARFLNFDMDELSTLDIVSYFSGNKALKNSKPISVAYSGHQFGHFNPNLGDGRAHLIGEVTGADGVLYDIQLKGSGPSQFSRRGDGKSALGPVIREYILSEAMNNLGVSTTRALCALRSGEDVYREDVLAGGVFTRVSKSHTRVGTFEHFSARGMSEEVKILADYSIKRLYPKLIGSDDIYFEFFKAIAKSKLDLVAKWMGLGFIHGVMNTDNTSIAGITIDYGPCAFMDTYSKNKVFSSIDRNARYAFNNQGDIALWNLSILANCFYDLLIHENESQDNFAIRMQAYFQELEAYKIDQYYKVMGEKFGFKILDKDKKDYIDDFLSYLEKEKLDFTNAFYDLTLEQFPSQKLKDRWNNLVQDNTFEAIELMKKSNPYLIPRNHQVEKAISAAYDGDDSHFHYLVKAYSKPFEYNDDYKDLMTPPLPDEIVHQTFCGT